MRLPNRVFVSASALCLAVVLSGCGGSSGAGVKSAGLDGRYPDPVSSELPALQNNRWAANSAANRGATLRDRGEARMDYGTLRTPPRSVPSARAPSNRLAPRRDTNPNQPAAEQMPYAAMRGAAPQANRMPPQRAQYDPRRGGASAQMSAGAAPPNMGAAAGMPGRDFIPPQVKSYDAVGYAAIVPGNSAGASAVHGKLPAGSYVEITALDSGNTIVAAVTQTAPLPNGQEIALSPAAVQQLGLGEGGGVRVRWTNPPQSERAQLRANGPAPTRLKTPDPLLEVLRKKLPRSGSSLLSNPGDLPPPGADMGAAPIRTAAIPPSSALPPGAMPSGGSNRGYTPQPQPGATSGAVDLPGISEIQRGSRASASASRGEGEFVVQAAAYSSKASAERAAKRIGGYAERAGSVYRVRSGPYTSRGQAQAALAKVRAAGYSGARVFTNK